MARKVRVEFEGAIYHVMCRGDRRECIFEDDEDRARFIQTLGQACQRTGWRIHAYVLMSNHYHWLVETPQANLVAGMRWFQSCFTIRYNRRHRKSGHLFQGRYKAVLVEPGVGYFALLSDYIHLNPARAGLIRRKANLLDYRWSSLPWYVVRPQRRPAWLEVERVLGELGYEDLALDRRAYAERLEQRAREGSDEEELKQMRRGWLLGGETFRDSVLDWLEKKTAKQRNQGRKLRREQSDAEHGERHAERIIQEVLEALGMTAVELRAARKGDWRKRLIGDRVRRDTNVSLRWLSDRLRMGSEGHVSRLTSTLTDLAGHPGRQRLEKALLRNARKKD